MTRDELAALLNGRAYRHEITREEERQAKAAGLLVIFGASDDLVEFRGVINDEIGANNGALFKLCVDGSLLQEWEDLQIADSDDPEGDAEDYFRRKALGFYEIAALWDEEGFSWVIKPGPLPHTPFVILDGSDNYCRGVVLDMAEVKEDAEQISEQSELNLLRTEVLDSLRTAAQYHLGNTALLDALMHEHASAPNSEAMRVKVLKEAGLLDEEGALLWSVLDQRKHKPMTWEQAVRKFVKQPAEVERLLAMGQA